MSSEILAVKINCEGGPKLVKLSRDDVTCWQLFLRFFGYGNLTKYEVHLKDVAAYLNLYDWKAASGEAYNKVAQIANKALLYKRDETLFRNVAHEEVEVIADHTRYRDGEVLSRLAIREMIYWNPSLQVQHVKALLKNRHADTSVRIEDANHNVMPLGTNVSVEALTGLRVFLEHHEPVFDIAKDPRSRRQTHPLSLAPETNS